MSKAAWALLTTFGPLVFIPIWLIQTNGPGVRIVNILGIRYSLQDAITLILSLTATLLIGWSLSFTFDWITRKEKDFRSIVALLLFLILMTLLLQPSLNIDIRIG
jgi:hypothetical protein